MKNNIVNQCKHYCKTKFKIINSADEIFSKMLKLELLTGLELICIAE